MKSRNDEWVWRVHGIEIRFGVGRRLEESRAKSMNAQTDVDEEKKHLLDWMINLIDNEDDAVTYAFVSRSYR